MTSLPYILILSISLFLAGCEQDTDPVPFNNTRQGKIALNAPSREIITAPLPDDAAVDPTDVQIEIGNTRYLFVMADHSTEDLKQLLIRADEITQTSLDHFDELEIALVIHGPIVEMFTEKNYQKNKELVDLAAKLDAFNVIDVKICEKSLANRGLSSKEIPSFIESVPYAPDEIKRLTADGYINL
jgi:intracellular sulfur oxidation DsrE/DsrF family protein